MINAAIEKFKRCRRCLSMPRKRLWQPCPPTSLIRLTRRCITPSPKALDEAFQLFEINFKDCQQLEREIALGQTRITLW